ncbi:Pentapeptide repeat family [Chlorella sorokiniana]|uniref:Pentapeptide repeat family n=1 Tax=Chlorella sorokiniana TaxID=3076 RepID=A0A2P6TS03_CHLSO|nr:Pentapeptide repeat family [Chlorella sorokiniana]|eukprot:PRW56837.1 Pentapeptide repeat family [Chlorella sorokiniana]
MATALCTPSAQCFKQQRSSKRRVGCRVQCAAMPQSLREAAGAALLSAAAAATLLLPAAPVLAVSGGGGAATSYAFQDLSGQDLRKNRYTKADLRGTKMRGANLEGVTLFGALATGADFTGANLRNADLELVEFEGADLSDAVLEGAMLTNAQFSRIKSIQGADFTDALIRKDVQQMLCKIADGVNSSTGVSTQDQLWLDQLITESELKYDENTRGVWDMVQDGRKRLEDTDEQIQEMKSDVNMPAWAFKLIAWTRRLTAQEVEENVKRHAALTSKRAEFMAGLQRLEQELQKDLQTSPPELKKRFDASSAAELIAAVGWSWAIEEESGPEVLQQKMKDAVDKTTGPAFTLSTAVTSSVISAWLVGWIGSWWGVNAYHLLQLPEEWGSVQAALPAWVAWTAPYLGATLGAYYVAPNLFKTAVRPITSDQQRFFQRIPLAGCAGAALAVAFCQCLIYQGLWQEAFSGWLGGSRDPFEIIDADLMADSLQSSMGTLVGSPKLPFFLVVPGAAVMTGLLEAGYYWSAMALRNTQVIVLDGEQLLDNQWQSGPFGKIEPGALSAEELPLVALRIALSGSYLTLEALLTGTLWTSVGTSAVGILAAMLLLRQSGGGSGGKAKA